MPYLLQQQSDNHSFLACTSIVINSASLNATFRKHTSFSQPLPYDEDPAIVSSALSHIQYRSIGGAPEIRPY